MSNIVDKDNSIYLELLKLLVLAAIIAVLFFMVVYFGGEHLFDKYYLDSEWAADKDMEYISKLQQKIDNEELASTDSQALSEWVDEQKIISMQIYKDNNLVYDSDLADTSSVIYDEKSIVYGWEFYHTVTFSDGIALVSIYGAYSYQFYNYAMIVELIISFILFLCVVMTGVRKKLRYIQLLSEEIEILEGGNLDYEITIQGNDELTTLAGGLDDMRKSFRSQIKQEVHLMKVNQRMITEMSHDLRTPLTSIMIYTDILKSGKYKNKQQMLEYIEKISNKTVRMKQLSDHLFEYALITGDTDIEMEEPETVEAVFYDLISETCGYLEHNGFELETDLRWGSGMISVNTEYISRILDNITSNIIKYADPSRKIVIRLTMKGMYIKLSFDNACSKGDSREESNKIGIRNIENMMRQMSGLCEVENGKDEFSICLIFRCIK